MTEAISMVEPIITALLTVVTGVIVYIVGEILHTSWIKPLQEYKQLKSKIVTLLTYYARDYCNIVDLVNDCEERKKEQAKVGEELRMLSSQLLGFIEQVSWFRVGIPSNKRLSKASEQLRGLSNSLFAPYNQKASTEDVDLNNQRVAEIYSLLKVYKKSKNKANNRTKTTFKGWFRHIRTETNYITCFVLTLLFLGLSLVSLGFEDKPFTVLSSLGCGGIASVIVAWLMEQSNNRINKYRNDNQNKDK